MKKIVNGTRLSIPYNNSSLSFDPIPYVGSFFEIKEQMEGDGLRMPVMKEAFAIISSSYKWNLGKDCGFYDFDNKNVNHYMKIIQKNTFGKSWITADTGVLYDKGKGFYVVNHIPLEYNGGVSVNLNKKNIRARLTLEDKNIIFIPENGCKLGDILSSEVEQHPLIKALIGKEGAKQAASQCSKVSIYNSLTKGLPMYTSINQSYKNLKLIDYFFDFSTNGKSFGIYNDVPFH